MVVNKPAGLVVHPGHGNYHGTLVNAIAWHLKDNPDYDANDPHVGLVHRIDKDTSGLLVIAKTPDAKTNLGVQFFNKTTKRRYRALVWGIVDQDEGTIVGSIARNPKDRMQMAVMADPTQGKLLNWRQWLKMKPKRQRHQRKEQRYAEAVRHEFWLKFHGMIDKSQAQHPAARSCAAASGAKGV